MRHRILLQTNPTWLRTGLCENAKTLLKYLYKTGKYDIAHYCTQGVLTTDPRLNLTPWKSYGSIPNNPQLIQEINADPMKQRDASYGAYNIDAVIQDFKPTIWIGSDDQWGFPAHAYINKPWYKKINSVQHITLDSLPIIDAAFEAAENTKYYVTWAKFAAKEMKRVSDKFSHVTSIYGAMDTDKFCPISEEERKAYRTKFGISDNTTVFLFVSRNQLRKQFVQCLKAFAHFKRENPNASAKLHFHTSYAEKGAGWDIMKMAAYYGIKKEDILATYVCKSCGQWAIGPYQGEDLTCPYCKKEKSMISSSIVHGVPDEEMKYIYGISDACISAFSSGGLEYHSVQSLLCGKPLACTNYSCGEDFCENDFVFKLDHSEYFEHGTNFVKATVDPVSIKRFMNKVWKSSRQDLIEWGRKGQEWAVKTFSIETIGAQWEALFDSMPIVDWDKIDLSTPAKNDKFPMPSAELSDSDFINTLYINILGADPNNIDKKGHSDWMTSLRGGQTREAVYNYFISVAKQDNMRAAPQDIWSLVDKTTGKRRGLIVLKESLGDCLMLTQLFKSFHEQYPDHDLYVATDPRCAEIFNGNPYVFRVIPYQPFMEQEMACIGTGTSDPLWHVYMHPGIQAQRILNYLSINNIAHSLHASA